MTTACLSSRETEQRLSDVSTALEGPEHDREADDQERSDSHARSLLVVEDDDDIRELLVELLEARGYRVFTAANGAEALAVLRSRERFSAILLDLMMPGMDGWQFRMEQQADVELASIPVIVMTASMYADGMPADTVLLPKPVRMDDVVAELKRLCGP